MSAKSSRPTEARPNLSDEEASEPFFPLPQFDSVEVPPADEPAQAATKSPDQWARLKGLYTPAGPYSKEVYDWRHAAASAAHGWEDHAYHAGSPFQLAEADYDAALAAVQTADMTPHEPAVSPHTPHSS